MSSFFLLLPWHVFCIKSNNAGGGSDTYVDVDDGGCVNTTITYDFAAVSSYDVKFHYTEISGNDGTTTTCARTDSDDLRFSIGPPASTSTSSSEDEDDGDGGGGGGVNVGALVGGLVGGTVFVVALVVVVLYKRNNKTMNFFMNNK